MREELLAVDWTVMPDGRVALEPKDAMKAKLGRSPDKFDAVQGCWAVEHTPQPLSMPTAIRPPYGSLLRPGGYSPGGWHF